MRSPDKIIDRFVRQINSGEREVLFEDEVTPSVVESGETVPDDCDWFDWRIRPYRATWIEEFEARLPAPLPPSFRSLVTRYIYPGFDVGPLWFFGNTPEGLEFASHELRFGVFEDELLSSCLFAHGYVQFARPAGGYYDPVCFDTRAMSRPGEYAIIRLDHEAILCEERIRIVEKVADSFLEFVSWQ